MEHVLSSSAKIGGNPEISAKWLVSVVAFVCVWKCDKYSKTLNSQFSHRALNQTTSEQLRERWSNSSFNVAIIYIKKVRIHLKSTSSCVSVCFIFPLHSSTFCWHCVERVVSFHQTMSRSSIIKFDGSPFKETNCDALHRVGSYASIGINSCFSP